MRNCHFVKVIQNDKRRGKLTILQSKNMMSNKKATNEYLTSAISPITSYCHNMRHSPLPVMMAGSIQLAVPSQLRLCVMPPVWFTLEEEEDDEDEEDEELGSPPKLMLMLGKSALSPSCHSFTFRLSAELLFSV